MLCEQQIPLHLLSSYLCVGMTAEVLLADVSNISSKIFSAVKIRAICKATCHTGKIWVNVFLGGFGWTDLFAFMLYCIVLYILSISSTFTAALVGSPTCSLLPILSTYHCWTVHTVNTVSYIFNQFYLFLTTILTRATARNYVYYWLIYWLIIQAIKWQKMVKKFHILSDQSSKSSHCRSRKRRMFDVFAWWLM